MTSPDTQSVRFLVALLIAIGLLAAACGGGTDELIEAEAESAGTAGSFCLAVSDLGTQLDDRLDINSELRDVSDAASDARRRTPDDAPPELREFFTSIEGVADTLAALVEADTDAERSAAQQPVAVATSFLDVFNEVPLTDYLTTECPDVAFTGAKPLLATAQQGATADDSIDAESTGTTASAPDPAEVVQLLESGPTFSYELVDILVGAVTATNADQLFLDEAIASDRNRLIVDLDFQATLAAENRFVASDLRLLDPAGRPTEGEQFFERGNPTGQVELAGRDTKLVSLAFVTDDFIENLDGWSIGVDRDGRTPTLITFDGEAATDYPIELEVGEPVQFNDDADECIRPYSATTDGSAIRLDAGVPFRWIQRSELDTRYLEVWVDITTLETTDCFPFKVGEIRTIALRVRVDGRLLSTDRDRMPDLETLPVDASRQLKLHPILIPNDATMIELVAPDDIVLATWTVDLPPVIGE